jgi:translocation and assembly module TamA
MKPLGITLPLIYSSILLFLATAELQANIFSRQQIDKNPEVNEAMATIQLQGADKALEENIRLMLPSRKPVCDADKEEIENFEESAERYLFKAAKGLGYYNSQFTIYPQKINQCWVFAINVQAGAATRIANIDVQLSGEGHQDSAFQKILAQSMYQRGDVLQQQKYSDYKSSLSNTARSLGYFDARFTEHQIRVNPQHNTADIVLHMDTGKRYRYGNIKLKQDILDADYLQRFVQIKEGQFYDSSDLSKQQLYLQTTGYYSDVLIHSAENKGKDYRIPIDMELTAKKRNAYEYRVGYGSDTGARVKATLDRRWTGGKGRKLHHEVQLSEQRSLLESRYTVPLRHPETENVFYNIKLAHEKSNDIRSDFVEVGAQYTRKNSGGFQQTAFLKYSNDSTQITGKSKFNTHYLLAGARIDKTKRNDNLHPDKGYRISLDVQAAHKSLVSTQNVFKVELDAKYLNPVGKGKVISHLRLGTVQAENFDLLPQSLRFFAGGRDSVRGYDFQSLGERNSDGKNIGGKNLVTASIEYDHPVSEKWSAASFIDTGNAFHDWNANNPLKIGVGVGVRWKSPVGAVSVDVAWPKDNLSDPHLHLSIGPEL